MRKSSSTTNSHYGHNSRQIRARRKDTYSGSVERSSHSDQVSEDAEAQPKATNSNRFAALPPKVPAPDTILQSNKCLQSDFNFRCDPNPSTAQATSSENNTTPAPPKTISPCANNPQPDPDPITVTPILHPTSKPPSNTHTFQPPPSPPTTPPPILLHSDLHSSPIRQTSPAPSPPPNPQRPRPALHPSFHDGDDTNTELVFHKPYRQPTPFPSSHKDGKRGRSRSNSSKDRDGGVLRSGAEEQKKEEEKKKGGVVERIGRGIARMSRKGSERAEVEEGWREGGADGDGDKHRLEEEEEDGEGGWEWVGERG